METNISLARLVDLSHRYGRDPEFVLAGGGNTSFKTRDTLWVKASGCSLAEIEEDGFVEMDRAKLGAVLTADIEEDSARREEHFKARVMAARVRPDKGQRPSVESALHNLLQSPYVVHTHPTWVNMILCCSRGRDVVSELFGDEALWVPYVDPGFVLAKVLRDLVAGSKRPPSIVFMANHGLVVGGETPEEIERRTDDVVAKVKAHVGDLGFARHEASALDEALVALLGPALRVLAAEGGRNKIVRFEDGDPIMDLVCDPHGDTVAKGGPLTPDQVVYCRSFPLWFEPKAGEEPMQTIGRLREAVAEHMRPAKAAAKVVLVKGLGMFAIGADAAAAETTRQVYVDAVTVMKGAERLGGISYLSPRQHEFIDNWEVEHYRRAVAAGSHKTGRAEGKVALVTGGAQGFGLGIAEDLVREGAHVVVADINAEGANEAARGLGRAIGVAMDVTDSESVRKAIHAAVRAFGGFDVVISNAGVLKAGSVKTQPQKEFEFVTKVNYIGYFLCVQQAAPILAVQRLADPERWTDVIQINSKSGLQGSNRNGAYAGGKFGGIGLTQSFALELIEDGIKVNSICPGNFFDGPLWADPENGLFAQYLRTGKVPGAKTIADVKRFYEAKVPMGRGCEVADVMKAVYYLMEQTYETGQALPVTGGQVMLS
jgi:rhamnose utilization protein RhaD (predicted bifunctional aldolase and dehydrogenase)/NAD(P)-dependent dehydrogenase (short-subunit alcohol dehydrogenase family)